MAFPSFVVDTSLQPDRYEPKELDRLQLKQRQFFWDQGAVIDRGGEQFAPGIWSALPPPLSPPGPIPDGISAWDLIYLNRKLAPGRCRLEGGRHCNFDIRSAIGQLVPEATFLGFDAVPITITLAMWHPDHFAALERLIPEILPEARPNPKVRAVEVYHPALRTLGIDRLWFQAMLLPRQVAPGLLEFDLIAFEHNPALAATLQRVGDPVPVTPEVRRLGGTTITSTIIPPSEDPNALNP